MVYLFHMKSIFPSHTFRYILGRLVLLSARMIATKNFSPHPSTQLFQIKDGSSHWPQQLTDRIEIEGSKGERYISRSLSDLASRQGEGN